jgi:ribulose-5-phosphate 4-epimerase/fuculose-1-phosphate aldolase
MNNAVDELVRLCSEIGHHVPVWVQGAGGNVSVKDVDDLWIKASGVRLDAVNQTSGFAHISLSKFRNVVDEWQEGEDGEAFYASALKSATLQGIGLGRPSMETGFHALLQRRYVIHFHSLPAVLMAHAYVNNYDKFKKWMSIWNPDLNIQYLSPQMPGWELSRAVSSLKPADVYILQNHGVILQDDTEVIIQKWREVEQQYCKDWSYGHLNKLLQSSSSMLDGPKVCRNEASGPLKIYFPDTAVFFDKISEIIDLSTESELSEIKQYRLKPDASEKSPDLTEIWQATQFLYQAQADLSELPDAISSAVAGLPLEKWRREQVKQNGSNEQC